MDNSCLATVMFMKEVDIVLTMGSSCIAILPIQFNSIQFIRIPENLYSTVIELVINTILNLIG